MDNLYSQKVINANNVFSDSFLDAKILYLYCFNVLPSVNYIGQIDGEKAFMAVKEKFSSAIKHVHQTRWYKEKKKEYQFDITIVVLNNNCLLEFDNHYCEIFHDGKQDEFVREITAV